VLAGLELTPTAPLDELQRCRGARGDRCICPAERKTARRRDHPVSLTEVEQQRSVRLLGACSDPDPGAVRKRSQADRLGAGGAQSSSQLPGFRPPVRLRGIVTSSATRRALYNEGNRPPTAGPDECKGDEAIAGTGPDPCCGGRSRSPMGEAR
jgi:hypothetical protein